MSERKSPWLSKDWGLEAQRAAEARLAVLWEILDEPDPETYEALELHLDPPMEAPFCGCETCVVRETLTAAWPIIMEAAKEEFL